MWPYNHRVCPSWVQWGDNFENWISTGLDVAYLWPSWINQWGCVCVCVCLCVFLCFCVCPCVCVQKSSSQMCTGLKNAPTELCMQSKNSTLSDFHQNPKMFKSSFAWIVCHTLTAWMWWSHVTWTYLTSPSGVTLSRTSSIMSHLREFPLEIKGNISNCSVQVCKKWTRKPYTTYVSGRKRKSLGPANSCPNKSWLSYLKTWQMIVWMTWCYLCSGSWGIIVKADYNNAWETRSSWIIHCYCWANTD